MISTTSSHSDMNLSGLEGDTLIEKSELDVLKQQKYYVAVKAEYLLPNLPRTPQSSALEEHELDGDGNDKVAELKKEKYSNRKGNNDQGPKKRPRDDRTKPELRLCQSLAKGVECTILNCKYNHDAKAYLALKPEV